MLVFYVCLRTNFNFRQMKLRITLFAVLSVFLSVCLTGCKQELKDFSFSYSMESVSNYKLVVMFDSNKTYRIEEYNYLMDNIERKRDPKIKEGTLSDEEYEALKPLLQKCNFFKMKDSYGFDEAINRDMGDIMYQVSFSSEGKEKYISIRDSETSQFSGSFVKLIGFINTFLNTHKND